MASNVLKWPGWVFGLFGQDKSFVANPVIGSRILNRCGLHVARLALAHVMTGFRRLILFFLVPADLRRRFRRDGFVIMPAFLSDTDVAAIRGELRDLEGDPRQMVQKDTLTQRILLDPETLARSPRLAAAVTGPAYVRPIAWAGAKWAAPLVYLQRIRNGVAGKGADPQKNVHSDTFHSTVKAWLFLEDVTPEMGPFTYVPGSHRLTWKRLKWEYRRSLTAATIHDGYSEKGSFRATPEDLAEMDLPAPLPATVKAGTLVIADTHGFHARGQAEAGRSRLEIFAYSRNAPFSPWPGIGLTLRTRIAERVVKSDFAKGDAQAAAKGGRATWHRIEREEMLDGL